MISWTDDPQVLPLVRSKIIQLITPSLTASTPLTAIRSEGSEVTQCSLVRISELTMNKRKAGQYKENLGRDIQKRPRSNLVTVLSPQSAEQCRGWRAKRDVRTFLERFKEEAGRDYSGARRSS